MKKSDTELLVKHKQAIQVADKIAELFGANDMVASGCVIFLAGYSSFQKRYPREKYVELVCEAIRKDSISQNKGMVKE